MRAGSSFCAGIIKPRPRHGDLAKTRTRELAHYVGADIIARSLSQGRNVATPSTSSFWVVAASKLRAACMAVFAVAVLERN